MIGRVSRNREMLATVALLVVATLVTLAVLWHVSQV